MNVKSKRHIKVGKYLLVGFFDVKNQGGLIILIKHKDLKSG